MTAFWAQADPMGGWASILLQGGAFMLLSYIVVIMVPAAMKDARTDRKENRDEREARDARFEHLVGAMQAGFESRNLLLVASIKEQTREITGSLTQVCRQTPRAP